MYAVCFNGTSTDLDMWSSGNGTISGEEVLVKVGDISLPWYYNLLVIVAYGLLFKIGTYICLRFLHKKR